MSCNPAEKFGAPSNGMDSEGKAYYVHPGKPRSWGLSKPSKTFLATFMVLLLLYACRVRHSEPLFFVRRPVKGDYGWGDITPTEDINLYPCFNGHKCARLAVPLDYTNPSPDHTAAIAITILEATDTSRPYGGPVLINPGGPGGSGVYMLLAFGELFQQVIGRHYSIVGFDPRGVNNTTPTFSCFEDSLRRKLFIEKDDGKVLTGGSEVGETYARFKALSESCGTVAGEEKGGYVNTPSVARDMLEISERLWGLSGMSGRGLQYWGLSYGSVLGSTFAAMFPERVERIVVDGICDVEDYYSTAWKANLQDTDKVLASFSTYCSQAGPLRCAFHTGSTPEDITVRLHNLLQKLSAEPLPIPSSQSTTSTPEIITESDVRNLLFASLYAPLGWFPIVAQILAALEIGDGRGYLEVARAGFECDCPGGLRTPNTGGEVALAIACSDGAPVPDDRAAFDEYLRELTSQTKAFGGVWAKLRLGCTNWKFRPKGLAFPGPYSGNTSTPLLIVGNSKDPVTPLRNAHVMSKNFPGSTVLEQNSEGHCSISAPSLCTAQHIRRYFETGEVPATGTVCEADMKPFIGAGDIFKTMSAEDAELLKALEKLAMELMPLFRRDFGPAPNAG
ncbi:TAP-like protein-domain-containing protein [Tuber indicum]|nr:TAP-like protein-domain-containing protein [Tuber indicum]